MSDERLPENWVYGAWHDADEPHYQHKYLHAEVRVSHDEVSYDADGRELPDGDTREVYRIWITHGIPFAASETDFEAPEPITDVDDAREWAHQLMAEMDAQFSLDNHHYVGAAMNAVLGTDEYNASGTLSAPEDYCCPICGVPFDLFRGAGNYEQAENHLEYADDEQHADVTLSLEEQPPEDEDDEEEIDPEALEADLVDGEDVQDFEAACRAVAEGKPPEDRHTVVVTREAFRTVADGEEIRVSPGSVLAGPAEFTDDLPSVEQLRAEWERDVAPLIGPAGDGAPVVRGDYFGRDKTVAIVAHFTQPAGEAEDVKSGQSASLDYVDPKNR